MRTRAITCALFYGLAPWQLYEREKHYEGWSYLRHLGVNLCIATRWLTFRETAEDRAFECEINQGVESAAELNRKITRFKAPSEVNQGAEAA